MHHCSSNMPSNPVSSPSSSNNRSSSSEKSFSSVFWSGEFVQSQPEQRPVHFYSRLFDRHNVLVNVQTYNHSNVFQNSISNCRHPSDIDLPFVYFYLSLSIYLSRAKRLQWKIALMYLGIICAVQQTSICLLILIRIQYNNIINTYIPLMDRVNSMVMVEKLKRTLAEELHEAP
jgi:hypothetical protein